MNSETETARGFYDRLRRLYQERLPFNRLLGLSVTSLNSDGGTMAFSTRKDLIGNIFHRTLHGGVISSVLDAVGGLTASPVWWCVPPACPRKRSKRCLPRWGPST